MAPGHDDGRRQRPTQHFLTVIGIDRIVKAPSQRCLTACLFAVVSTWSLATALSAQDVNDPAIGLKVEEARLKANRIRKISGKHVTLFTDLPSFKEVDEPRRRF